MVKEMWRLDKFYYVNESSLRSHKDYPPFISLFELLWCWLSMGFSESNISFALHFFEFSILLPPVFDDYFESRRKVEKIIMDLLLCVSVIGVVVFLDSTDVFNTIYTDTLIALQFAYSIFLIYSDEIENHFGVLCYSLILTAVLMTKQVGIAFCMLSLFYAALCAIFGRNRRTELLNLLSSLVMPVAFYLLWNYLIKDYELIKQFDLGNISVSGMKEILSGGSFQLNTIKMYVNALFKTSIFKWFAPITFLSSLPLEILLLELIKRYSLEKKKKTFFELCCIVGTAGYALMMLILYAFCYPEREAVVLKSYERYMTSFICALIVCILFILIDTFKQKINDMDMHKAFLCLLTVLTVLDGNRLLDFVPQILLGNRFASYEKRADFIKERVHSNSRVFIVYNQDSNDNYPAFIAYYCDDVFFNERNMDLYKDKYSDMDDYKKAVDELKTYNYLYVIETSDVFNYFFNPMNNGEDFLPESIYRITVTDNDMKTELVN
ncbi:MAG: hypothetical protein IKE50_05420 [Erysipelotrichaceae bacterium]|nr:hypothetical protein [Erysipelotrichaceae bacterium]